MPDKVVTLNPIYAINATTDDVIFETIIGDIGQTSKTDVTLTDPLGNDNNLFVHQDGNIPNTTIGKNNNLSGFKLTVTCIITVTSATSNYCEELIKLTGGINDITYKLYDSTLTNIGDSTTLTSIIDFE